MKTISLFAMACLMGCSSAYQSKAPKKELEFDAYRKVFSNGLTAIVVENPKMPVFSYYTFYKVGSKFETPGITGASHFLEHMMFKGAKKYKEGDFDKHVEGNGGRNNAYTTNDLTVYYEDMPKDFLEKMVDIEADRMENLTLAQDSFEKERNVVLEERRMRYENSDKGKIFLRMMKEVFKGTPYGTSVIGEIKDLKTVTRDEIYSYFKKYYSPNNAIIVIAGDVKHKETFDLIEKKFGSIKAYSELNSLKRKVLQAKGFQVKREFDKNVKLKGQSPTPNFMLAYSSEKIGSREGFLLDIISSMLGTGATSYLSKKFVISKKPLLSNVYAANYTLQHAGVFFIGGQLLEGSSLYGTQEQLIDATAKFCEDGLDEKSLRKVKNQFFVSMFSDLDSNNGVAKFLGDREVYFDDYQFYKKEMQIYENIELDELKEVCTEYLDPKRSIFLSIWKGHKEEQ